MVKRIVLWSGVGVLLGCAPILGVDKEREDAECTSTGELQCDEDRNRLQKCGEDWRWKDEPPCPESEPVCSKEACVAVTQVTAGNSHTCAVLGDGALRCWGHNKRHQLGTNGDVDSPRPLSVPGLLDRVESVALGGNDEDFGHTCAIVGPDREVWCWGANQLGQVGVGTSTVAVEQPEKVHGLQRVRAISLGGGSSCAILEEDDSLWCWGLGTGENSPIRINTVGPVRSIASGAYHFCAIAKDSGRLYCWFHGTMQFHKQSGQEEGSATPTLIEGLKNVTYVAAGAYHTCAETADKKLWCWGQQSCGELGDGNQCPSVCGVDNPLCDSSEPLLVQLPSSMAVDKGNLALGEQHSCALVVDNNKPPENDPHKVYCWGRNDFLEAGMLSSDQTSSGSWVNSPSASLAVHIKTVTAGYFHTCALSISGTVRCWGRNDWGQLGNGSTDASLPAAVVW